MARLSLTLLGGFEITLEGERVTAFPSNKVRALLAYLAVESDHPHRRESLATLLWPGYPDRSARTNLRNALYSLRTVIGDREAEPPFLNISRTTLQFNTQSDHQLDVHEIDKALRLADQVPVKDLTKAANLYTGDFLAGFTLEDAVGFDDWASVTRERLRRKSLELLGVLVDRLIAEEDHHRALTYARRRVKLEPWLEDAQRQLIHLLAETGQRSEALRQYRRCVQVLEEELGAQPTVETQALYDEIRTNGRPDRLRADIAPTTPVPSPPTIQRPAFLGEDVEPVVTDHPVFVGREPELARLDGYLDEALAGCGHVAFIVGGPGRGKTALMRAFAERAMVAHSDLLIAQGACNATSGVGDAYLPFREAMAMLTGDVESRWRAGTVSRDHAQCLWSALSVTLPVLVTHGPHIVDTLVRGRDLITRAEVRGLGEASWLQELRALANRPAPSGLRQQALFQQVTNTFYALASKQPLMLMLDDLQWADQGSTGLLFHLGRRLAGSRILILGAYRPEAVPSVTASQEPMSLSQILNELKRQYGDVWIDLQKADAREGQAFVDALVDAETNCLSQAFRQALYAVTGGHPLFTVELLHHLRDQGKLVDDTEQGWCEEPDLEWDTLPSRVEAVMEARLAKLSAQQRDLLSVAAVEGETFTVQVIAQVTESSEREVLHTLSQVLGRTHRLVREVDEIAVEGRPLYRYIFRHTLFHNYVLRQLSNGESKVLHGDVATALEAIFKKQRKQIAVQLAYHYGRSHNVEKAIHYSLQAGHQAQQSYAYSDATHWYEEALRTLALSASVDSDEQRLTALTELGKASFKMGELSQAADYLRRAIALGREMHHEAEALAILYHWLGETLFWQDRNQERVAIGEEGLTLFNEDSRSLGKALMNQVVAYGAKKLGNWERAAALTRETAGLLKDLAYREELLAAYGHVFAMYVDEKQIDAAGEHLRSVEEQVAPHDNTLTKVLMHDWQARIYGLIGKLNGQLNQLTSALTLATRIGVITYQGYLSLVIARTSLAAGDLDQAASYGQESLDLARTLGYEPRIAECLYLLGQVALCADHLKRAHACFQEAKTLEEGEEVGFAYYLLGRVSQSHHENRRARKHFEESLAIRASRSGDLDPLRFLFPLLDGLEAVSETRDAFRAWCRTYRTDHHWLDARLQQWWLAPAGARARPAGRLVAEALQTSTPPWHWVDPMDDCAYIPDDGLVIHATNGRQLWHLNLSAPRLVRTLPPDIANPTFQITCEPALEDRPARGGILLWQDKENYLWLEVGRFGERDVAFGGCLANKDLVIGRGRLPAGPKPGWAMGEPVTLRLAATGDRVEALCSLDKETWFSVGHTTFPFDETVQVGIHALGLGAVQMHSGVHTIGMIDRTIYHGAYPEGTAIRFTSFKVWSADNQG